VIFNQQIDPSFKRSFSDPCRKFCGDNELNCRRPIGQFSNGISIGIVSTPESKVSSKEATEVIWLEVDFLLLLIKEAIVFLSESSMDLLPRLLGNQEGDFPVSEAAARETVALPIYPELTRDQIAYVADRVREFIHTPS